MSHIFLRRFGNDGVCASCRFSIQKLSGLPLSSRTIPVRSLSSSVAPKTSSKPPINSAKSHQTSLAWHRTSIRRRMFTTSRPMLEEQKARVPVSYKEEMRNRKNGIKPTEEQEDTEGDEDFARSEKAAQASKLNLTARLSKDGTGKDGKKGGTFSEVGRLLRIAWPEKRMLGAAFVMLLTSSAVSMSIPFSIGKILDMATQSKEMLFGMNPTTFYLALGGVLALGASANYGRIIILRIVGERIVTKMRSKLYKKTFIQNAEFFDANRVGDLISRLGSDTIIVGKSITQNLSDGLRAAVSGGAGLAMMAWVSLKLTSILALMFPPVAVGAFFYGRTIRNLSRRIQKSLGSLTKIAEERLGNVRTSQSFAGEIQEVHRYNTQVRHLFGLGRREAILSATFFSASGFAGNMTVLALLYVGGGMVSDGTISIGDLTSFLMYTAYAGSSLFGLSSFYSELMKGVGAASRLFELQDRNPEKYPTVGEGVKSLKGDIEFRNVKFSYPTRPAVTIFEDLNFKIKQGRNIAIVAPSGAGKSTVAQLLLRFYSPNSGTILVDGKDIGDMNAKQLRRKIGYVGQEPVLFSGTIAENIAYGRPTATRHDIVTAARKANCQFIGDFPDGLETPVGARGTQLSGGQKQRIAIARALLKNPDILILDEATSALDAESETLVNQALTTLLQGNNTTISIAHRLSTIKRSDTIIVIGAGGRVEEQGSYAELSAKKDGAFNRLMEWQMSGGEGVGPSEKMSKPPSANITEKEEIEYELEKESREAEAEGQQESSEEGTAVRKENVTTTEAVAERAAGGARTP